MSGFSFEEGSEEAYAAEYDVDPSEQPEPPVAKPPVRSRQASVPITAAEEALDEIEGNVRPRAIASEVERRLALAECYRLILQQPLFGQNTVSTRTVQAEITDFCQRRLEVLMGIRQSTTDAGAIVSAPMQPPLFSKEELTALRAIAKVALKRQQAQSEPQQSPTLNTVPAPLEEVEEDTREPLSPPRSGPITLRRIQPAVSTSRVPVGRQLSPARKKIVREREGIDLHTGEVKTVKIDVTPQVGIGNPHMKPTPGKEEMEMIMDQRAAQEAASIARAVPTNVKQGLVNKINQGD